MEYLLLMILGMAIGLYFVTLYRQQQEKLLDQYVDQALDLYKKFTIPLQCEQENNMIYCYNNDTKDFVCQGTDIEEIKANFKARYPDHGSYIMHESLHLFPETQTEEDPTDQELRQRVKEIHIRDNT
jgi:hypothetical protein